MTEIDISQSVYGNKSAEFFKILSVITSLIVKQREFLKSNGIINHIKIFIMEQLNANSDQLSRKNLVVCFNYLLKDLAFTDAEISKYRLLEILLSQ